MHIRANRASDVRFRNRMHLRSELVSQWGHWLATETRCSYTVMSILSSIRIIGETMQSRMANRFPRFLYAIFRKSPDVIALRSVVPAIGVHQPKITFSIYHLIWFMERKHCQPISPHTDWKFYALWHLFDLLNATLHSAHYYRHCLAYFIHRIPFACAPNVRFCNIRKSF